MAKEIERRWKLNKDIINLDSLEKFITKRNETEVILFNAGPDTYIRYRYNRGNDHALFTIKKGKGLERKEFNKNIDLNEYKEIRNDFGEGIVAYSTGLIEFDGIEYEFKYNGKSFIIEKEFDCIECADNFTVSDKVNEMFFEITGNSEYNLFKFLGLK